MVRIANGCVADCAPADSRSFVSITLEVTPTRVKTPILLPDYHMHTTLCGHARGTVGDYVQRAIRLGLSEIGFSEHIYLYHLPLEERDPELAMREVEMPLYVDMVRAAQRRYPQIPIRLGLEADYIEGHEERLGRILASHPFDYVYGSVHFIEGWGFDDPRYISGTGTIYVAWDNASMKILRLKQW